MQPIDPEWLPRALEKLGKLAEEDPPLVPKSQQAAWDLILALGKAGIKPQRIVRTAENEVSLWFRLYKKIRVGCCDDGKFVMSVDGPSGKVHTEVGTEKDVVSNIQALMRRPEPILAGDWWTDE